MQKGKSFAEQFGMKSGEMAEKLGYSRQGYLDLFNSTLNRNEKRFNATIDRLIELSNAILRDDIEKAQIRANTRLESIGRINKPTKEKENDHE